MTGRGLAALVIASAALWCGCAQGLSGAPLNVTGNSAQIGGTVVSDTGGEVEYWVQYGPTAAHGSETEHALVETQKNQLTSVFVDLGGLALGTTYHYRLCAQDAQQVGGPACGEDVKFKTQPVVCDSTITQDVRLVADMHCEHGPIGGWTIGADGVDINLDGHTFFGFPTRVGITNAGYDDVTIRNGTVGGWAVSISLSESSRNVIRAINALRITIGGGADNEVRHTAARLVIADSDRAVVADSTATAGFGSRSAPAIIVFAHGARIVRTQVQGTSFEPGILVLGSSNQLLRNRVAGANMGGIVIQTGEGNVVAENEVIDGVAEDWQEPQDRLGDGIFVGPDALATLLRANVATNNDGDGIEAQSASTRLRDNRATGNGDLGIDAAAGATDLGGNTASGNGDPLQCRNVFCS